MTYNQIFSTLKENNPSLNPASIMIDYERAALNALTHNFPNAEIQGFFFTSGKQFGDTFRPSDCNNQNDEEFAVIMKQFRALAFIPAIDVFPCYEELVDSLSDELVDDLSVFTCY